MKVSKNLEEICNSAIGLVGGIIKLPFTILSDVVQEVKNAIPQKKENNSENSSNTANKQQ